MIVRKEFVVEPNEKGNLIAESFGVTGGYVNKIADLSIPDEWSVLYITGESGCGKTTIAREIADALGVPFDSQIEIPHNKPLFLWGGESEENQAETLKKLSYVGLSDAVLWLNYYNDLSDSQKARARMYLMLEKSDLIIVDEFLSTLDRETAKAVAYCFQKAVRIQGKKLVAVTAHNDLQKYLQADYVILGEAFPSRWSIKKNEYDLGNPILYDLIIKWGEKEDYKVCRLGELHYKGKYTGGTKEYLFAYLNEKMVGVLVSTYNMHTGGRRISRLVVHPSYRGCGIGKKLVKEYLSEFPDTDVVASMALYNPVFERAGMHRVDDVNISSPAGLKSALKQHGFDFERWYDKQYLSGFCDNISARAMLSEFSNKATSMVCPGGKYLTDEEIKEKIVNSKETAARVLFGFRPRTMAKYINKGEEE